MSKFLVSAVLILLPSGAIINEALISSIHHGEVRMQNGDKFKPSVEDLAVLHKLAK